MASKFTEALARAIAPVIRRYVADSMSETTAKLEARIVELEGQGVRYCGVFQSAMAYKRGDLVTFDGSMWVALRNVVVEKPGASESWQLCVKRGRDGKDAGRT